MLINIEELRSSLVFRVPIFAIYEQRKYVEDVAFAGLENNKFFNSAFVISSFFMDKK